MGWLKYSGDGVKKILKTFLGKVEPSPNYKEALEIQSLALGRLLSEQVKQKQTISSLEDVEFRIFSQFGDDGIIQWLIHNLEIPHETFIEFGVSDYTESNTRFLLLNNNWSGYVLDGSPKNIARIQSADYYWRHHITARCEFIDKRNINKLLSDSLLEREIGLLHIDLDGNDYWIWEEVDCISPVILILEYNSVFGSERAVTIPYNQTFLRNEAHYSNLYFGASIKALVQLSEKKGYAFIGCNSAGNNAYFVREDKLNNVVKPSPVECGYVVSKFRESRDEAGKLTFLSGSDRYDLIKGLPVYNVETKKMEGL